MSTRRDLVFQNYLASVSQNHFSVSSAANSDKTDQVKIMAPR